MTAVQVTMVAACLAVVSCEPPVITQAYGVPSDSYSPVYSSGGYGGGGGGGYDGGHHGGHETVGRGGAVSAPGNTGEVVSYGGSESKEQNGGGSSAEEETSSSSIGCPDGVNSLGGSSDDTGQTGGSISVQKATSSSQLDETSSNGCSEDKESFGEGGVNLDDSTGSSVLGFEPDTTISDVQDENILPMGESVYSNQPESSRSTNCTGGDDSLAESGSSTEGDGENILPMGESVYSNQPESSRSTNCTGGDDSLAESGSSTEGGGRSVRDDNVQVGYLGAQIDTYLKDIPDSSYYNSDAINYKSEIGIQPNGDTLVSESENTYYREDDSISSGEQDRFFNRGIDQSESVTNAQTDVNYSQQYPAGLPQPNKNNPEQRNVQNNVQSSPVRGVPSCNNEQTYINGDSSVQSTEYDPRYDEYKPELIVRGVGDEVKEVTQDNLFFDDTYKASALGPWFPGSGTPNTQDDQQDYLADEQVTNRVIQISQPSGSLTNTNTNGASRNENSYNTKYTVYSRGSTGYEYPIPPKPWDEGVSNDNSLNAWEIKRDNIDQNSFPKLDNGIVQRQSGNLPRGGLNQVSGYESLLDSRNVRGLPDVINEVHKEHTTDTVNLENSLAIPYGDLQEIVLKGSTDNAYQHIVNGYKFKESPTNHGVYTSNNFASPNSNKRSSVVDKESWPAWKHLQYGGVQPPSSNADGIIGDQVKYASKFTNYLIGQQSPHESSLQGHFIVASVPNATKSPITTQQHAWDTSSYVIHSRKGREGTGSWDVPHPNTLLKPPILSLHQLSPKPGIGGYPGYGIGGYRVREEETNSGDYYIGSENPGYNSQEQSYSAVRNSTGIGEGLVNYQGAWKSAGESNSNQRPNYPSSKNIASRFIGISSNTQGNQPTSENKWYSGYGSETLLGTPSYEGKKPLPENGHYPGYSRGWVAQTYGTGEDSNGGQATLGSGGNFNNQAVGYSSNQRKYSSIGRQSSSGAGIYQGYGSSEVDHKYSSEVYGKHSQIGSLENVNQQGSVYSYNQGSSNAIGDRPSPGTAGYQGYGSGGLAPTHTSGISGKTTQLGSGGYSSQQEVGYSFNRGPSNPIGNRPSSESGDYGYGSGGVTYSSGGHEQHSTVGSGRYANQQGVEYSKNQVSKIGNEPSPEMVGYQGYGGKGFAGTSSSGAYGKQATLGYSGYANQQRAGFNSNRGSLTPISNQPPLTTKYYQGYGSAGGDHTSTSGHSRAQSPYVSGGYISQQGVGLGYDQGSTSSMGKQPSPGTGGYQGYGKGGVSDTSSSGVFGHQATFSSCGLENQQRVGYNSNPVAPLSTHPPLTTGDYKGFGSGGGALMYTSGTSRDQTDTGSGLYVNKQGVGYSSNQGAPSNTYPPLTTGVYEGYGSGGGDRTVVSREQTATGSGLYLNQQGVGPSYNQDFSTPSGNQPSPGTGGYQGYGSGGVSHTSSSVGYGQQTTFGSVGIANQQGVLHSLNRGYSTSADNHPSQGTQGTGGNKGYWEGGVAKTSTSAIHGEHAKFGSGVYGNSRLDYTPGSGLGGYSGYGHGRVSQTFGSGGYNIHDGVGYISSADINNVQGNKPTPGIGGPLGYVFDSSGGGYGTVWKDVGGWRNFTVRPAGFLGYGLSAKPYQFGYSVNDQHTGADFRQQEQSDGNTVKGQYRVALPDGRTQIVTYTADWKTGFHADVRYEGEASYPAVWGGSGGYAPSGAPSSNYGAPSSNYGAPAGGTGSQYNNIGHSTGGYGHGGYRK